MSRTTTPEEIATRVALIRMTFPVLAVAADADEARRARLGTTGRGLAEGVIHVAVTTPTLWNGGTVSAAEGLDGSWESYIELACRRITSLRGCARRDA